MLRGDPQACAAALHRCDASGLAPLMVRYAPHPFPSRSGTARQPARRVDPPAVAPSAQTRACKQRKTLVLDLDETLVHSSLDGFDLPDFSFPVFFNGREHMVAVRQRPHLVTFLEECALLFEVVVFTASQKVSPRSPNPAPITQGICVEARPQLSQAVGSSTAVAVAVMCGAEL